MSTHKQGNSVFTSQKVADLFDVRQIFYVVQNKIIQKTHVSLVPLHPIMLGIYKKRIEGDR